MSVLLQVNNGSKAFGSKRLFDDFTFSANEGDHFAVIGPNGAGKSTFFRILAGQDEFDSGDITFSKKLRMGYLAQEDRETLDLSQTVMEYIEETCYLPFWEVMGMRRFVGLEHEVFSMKFSELSGGYRMRCRLLGILGNQPNLILLDEPTNYLDLESILALEEFLKSYKGAFLLISHDREFLRKCTNKVLEIEAGESASFPASLDEYFEHKALMRDQLEKQARNTDAKRKQIQGFIDRFGAKASKAKQAQSKVKLLNKIERIDIKPLVSTAQIRVPEPVRTGKLSFEVNKLELGYDDKVIVRVPNFHVFRGDHLAIVGENGAGKTTLLKALAGQLKPFSGDYKLGHNVDIGYYAQHVAMELPENSTVYEALIDGAHPDITPQQVKDLAGSLLFSNDDIQKRIPVLSGGEKSRVALGRILLKKSPCLLLDEPTNHLDVETVEALTQALVNFEGTLITVSHDRTFIKRLANKVIEIKNGQLELFPGTYDEYVWHVKNTLDEDDDEKPAKQIAETKPKKPDSHKMSKEDKKKERALEKRRQQIESKLSNLNAELEQVNAKIQENSSPELIASMTSLTEQVESLENEWLELSSD